MNDTRLNHLFDDVTSIRRQVADILADASPHPDDIRELNVVENLLATAAKRINGLMHCTATTFGVGTRCELAPHGDDINHRNGKRTWTTRSQLDLAKQWGL